MGFGGLESRARCAGFSVTEIGNRKERLRVREAGASAAGRGQRPYASFPDRQPNVTPAHQKNVVSEQSAKRSAIETGSRSNPRFYAVSIPKPSQNQKKSEIPVRRFPIFYTLGNCAEAALRLCLYASGSIAEMPRCSTGVEKTICVRVRPKRCSWLINWSSSCVVWKQTSTSME